MQGHERSTPTRPSTQRVEGIVVITAWIVAFWILRSSEAPSGRVWVSATLIALAASLAITAVLAFPLPSTTLNTPRLGAARRITGATLTSLLIGVPLALQTGVILPSSVSAVGFVALGIVTWLILAISASMVPLPVSPHEPLLRSDLRHPVYPRRRRLRGAKRVIDFVVSLIALIVMLPLLIGTALAIRLHDRGPALFVQERVGRHGRVFRIYKFRSMVTEAEYLRRHMAEDNERTGPLFKVSNDPRVTPIGRIIRQLSIDELPQLLNVLKGEMSLVGPRPALATELEDFSRLHRDTRLLVKPGITGLWQAEARSDPDFGKVEALDMRYVREWSVSLDLWILVATVIEMLMTVLALPLKRMGMQLTTGEQMVVTERAVSEPAEVIDVVIPFPEGPLVEVAPPSNPVPLTRARRTHQANVPDQASKVS